MERRTISSDDIVEIIKNIVELNDDPHAKSDDIDHLGQRRVRYIGEMLQRKFVLVWLKLKRNIQDRMSTIDTSTSLPIAIISQRPLQARVKKFFTAN